LAKDLRARLRDLDAERERIITELTHIEGQRPPEALDGGVRVGGRGNFSIVTVTIMSVLQEAGPEGLSAAEVQDTVSEDLGYHVRRDIIATQLSRNKRKGKVKAIGQRGALRYVYVEGANGAAQ